MTLGVLRPCLGRLEDGTQCRVPVEGSRCPDHEFRNPYGSSWRRIRGAAVQRHLIAQGSTCPGYGVPPHFALDLTGDHRVPVSAGGSGASTNIAVLCNRCNARKGAA